jgi:hypothetical protein
VNLYGEIVCPEPADAGNRQHFFRPRLFAGFSGPGSRNINRLILDFLSARTRAHQNILWIMSLLLGLLQRETAKFVAVIPLFRLREAEEFRGY